MRLARSRGPHSRRARQDEEPFVTQIWIGQFAVAASVGVLLVLITVMVARAVRRRQRPRYSLARFVAIIVVAGVGVLGGMHWRESARAFADAKAEHQAASARFKAAAELVNKAWPVKDGVMTVAVGKGYQKTKQLFGAIRLPGGSESLMSKQSFPRLASAFRGGERR